MTCPICDQKPINCDCTPRERAMWLELQDLEDRPAVVLTDAEREAVEDGIRCVEYVAGYGQPARANLAESAATLRGLLERFSDRPKPIATPAPSSTPAKCSVPPEWKSRPYWVDPPEGWRYGFPRLYDPQSDGNMRAWMVANGYPKRLAKMGLRCTFTAYTDDGEK